jgi:hypothetical protein
LEESTSSTPYVTCESNSAIIAFDVAADPSVMPTAWMFSDSAPLFRFYKSPSPPSFGGWYDLYTEGGRLRFWEDLERASLQDLPELEASDQGPSFPGEDIARSARKKSSWTSGYSISQLQGIYLTALIDPVTGTHPLLDETALQHAAFVTAAPMDAILSYVRRRSVLIADVAARMKLREEKEAQERRRRENAKRILSAKAAEARQRIERDWRDFLASIHEEPLSPDLGSRLAPVHDEFLRIGGRMSGRFKSDKFQADILATLGIGLRRRPGPIPPDMRERFRRPLPTSLSRLREIPGGNSVYDLISQQVPREVRSTSRKSKQNQREDTDLSEFTSRSETSFAEH